MKLTITFTLFVLAFSSSFLQHHRFTVTFRTVSSAISPDLHATIAYLKLIAAPIIAALVLTQ